MENTFSTREEGKAHCQSYCITSTFKLYSKGFDSVRNREVFICHRAGVYRSKSRGARNNSSTITTGCPYKVVLRQNRTGDMLWCSAVINDHNHPLDYRVKVPFTAEEVQTLATSRNAGIAPRQQLAQILNQNPNRNVGSKDVYNANLRSRIELLQTRKPLQVLMDLANEKDYLTVFKLGENGNLSHAFFCHPDAAKLALQFQSVLVLDCTYKTNRYKMPLLHFVGCTAFNTTFTIAYAFLSKEEVADYTWALNALSQSITGYTPNVFVTDRERALISAIQHVYPARNICICLWHINKNVLSHCKKLFSSGLEFNHFLKMWNYVCYAATEEDYESNVMTLRSEFFDHPALQYVETTWLNEWKANFVAAWTRKELIMSCPTIRHRLWSLINWSGLEGNLHNIHRIVKWKLIWN